MFSTSKSRLEENLALKLLLPILEETHLGSVCLDSEVNKRIRNICRMLKDLRDFIFSAPFQNEMTFCKCRVPQTMCSEPQSAVYYDAFNYVFCTTSSSQFLTYDSEGSFTAEVFTAIIKCLGPIIWPFTANQRSLTLQHEISLGVIQVTAKFDCVMQEHVHSPPLHKVSLTCILDTDFTQGPKFAKALSVLRVAKATHSSYSTFARRNNTLNLLSLQRFIFLLLYQRPRTLLKISNFTYKM